MRRFLLCSGVVGGVLSVAGCSGAVFCQPGAVGSGFKDEHAGLCVSEGCVFVVMDVLLGITWQHPPVYIIFSKAILPQMNRFLFPNPANCRQRMWLIVPRTIGGTPPFPGCRSFSDRTFFSSAPPLKYVCFALRLKSDRVCFAAKQSGSSRRLSGSVEALGHRFVSINSSLSLSCYVILMVR